MIFDAHYVQSLVRLVCEALMKLWDSLTWAPVTAISPRRTTDIGKAARSTSSQESPKGTHNLSDSDESNVSVDLLRNPRESRPLIDAIDTSIDPSELRWIGTEFIYFPDIPWRKQSWDGTTSRSLSHDPYIWSPALTLGVLEDVMDAKISPDCLLSSDAAGRSVLSGEGLSRLVVPWARLHRARRLHDAVTSRLQGERATHALIAASSALDDDLYSKNSSLVELSEDSQMLCEVATFLMSLAHCVRAIWDDGRAAYFLEFKTRLFGEVAHALRDRFLERWGEDAAYGMERLAGSGIPFVAYASSCEPTRNHVTTVDPATYRPKHVATDCTCSFVRPHMGNGGVGDILRANEIPVVAFDGTSISVLRASDTPYLAISHVWADGLGSTTEEGLPHCQVARLSALARTLLPGIGAFWMDSLCVPKAKELRGSAIRLMARTYAEADKVLVIDGGIRSQCTRATPKAECLLRIATSGWMQRIWTLQEGMLARELFFELADGLVDCTYFNGEPYSAACSLIPLLKHRPHDDASLTYQQRALTPPRCTVNDLIPLLRHRSTSKPQDEPLAISGLLDVDAAQLVRLESGEERMKALLIAVRVLPRQLAVFGWFCQRLTLPNFTWAPASISQVLWPGDADDPHVAICTEEGLFADLTVVSFPPVTAHVYTGVIATIHLGKRPGSPSSEPENAFPGSRCSHAGCASRCFNLVISQLPFADDDAPHGLNFERTITYNGFLMKQPALPESMREEGVSAVMIQPKRDGDAQDTPLHCKFVAPGSARLGLPDTVRTTRSRREWLFVNATVETLRPVRLT